MSQASILIVEDDAILAMDLEGMIARMGYSVAGPLAFGEEAIAFLSANKVDLVLMDIELAGKLNGITAAEMITRTADIPIVFLTGFSHDPLLEQAKIAAPYGYLIKPVPERELAATLQMALHRHMLDRKLQESRIALAKSEERLRMAQEAAHSGTWEWNLLTDENVWSDELWKLYDLDPKDCKASYATWLQVIHPEDRAETEERVKKAAAAAGELNAEWRVILPNGATRWLMSRGKPFFDNNGRVTHYLGIVLDITERRLADEALRANRKQLSSIIEFLPNATLAVDKEGRVIIWNKAIEEMTGIAATEMIGQGDYAYMVPFYGERRKGLIDLLLTGQEDSTLYPHLQRIGDSLTTEVFCKALYGNKGAWVFAKAVPLYDQEGHIIGAIESIRDITDQKLAETYGEMGREVLQILNEPGGIADSLQRVLAVVKTRTGLDAVGIRLQDGDDFPYLAQEGFSKDFLMTENSLIERNAKGGVCRDKDGKILLGCTCGLVIAEKTDPTKEFFTPGGSFWTNDSRPLLDIPSSEDPRLHPRNHCIHQGYSSFALVPIRNQNRSVGLLQLNDRRKNCFTSNTLQLLEGIASHIGEALMRKKAEEALKISEARYAATLSVMETGLWDWHIPSGRVTMSAVYYRILGFANGEFPATYASLQNLVHPADSPMVARFFQQSVDTGQGFVIDVRMKMKSGAWKWVSMRGKAIEKDAEGKALRMVGTLSDITKRKQTEEEMATLQAHLNQAQKMEAVGTLAGGIAHDFNNILAAILGYAELVKDDCPQGSRTRGDIEQVLKASRRAKDLVKQILTFSRWDKTEDIPLQPAMIIRETIKMLRSSLPTTIDIRQDLDPQSGWVMADPTQIHQILMNLCTNAFHAMEETGGILSITLKTTTLSPDDLSFEPSIQPGQFMQLSIGDTGSGINPEIQDKIFDPYFTTKAVGKGTGMGLAIIHGIVKNYGGVLSCRSQPGKGSIFDVYLPVLEDAEPPENTPENPLPLGNERILVVDDEEALVKMIKSMLEVLGYKVTTRTNSLEALAIFEAQPQAFDLVITDQTMPAMTGSDLAHRMLQIRPDLPIILCTGYSSLISEEKAMAMGIKGFALKPLAKKDIAALIRKVLRKGESS
jgi:PAS domain S-box-containing protein